jgi:hypothetical protein
MVAGIGRATFPESNFCRRNEFGFVLRQKLILLILTQLI